MNSPSRPPLALAVLIAFGVVLAQALLVPLFAAPAANLAPRDLPVVVAGPAPAAHAMAGQLRQAEPGAFEVTTVPDAAAAEAALRDRDAYAAFVIGTDRRHAATPPAAAARSSPSSSARPRPRSAAPPASRCRSSTSCRARPTTRAAAASRPGSCPSR